MPGLGIDVLFLINVGIITTVTGTVIIAYFLGHAAGKRAGKKEGKREQN